MYLDSDDLWSDIDEKALLGRRNRPFGKGRGRARKLLKRPKFDGDNDGFITNPFTGRDEIPWKRDAESAEDAIKRFFGGTMPGALSQDFVDERKTPFKGKAKVSKLERGDVLPNGFDKGKDLGDGKQFQIAAIKKLGNGRTRLSIVDLSDKSRTAKNIDLDDELEIPGVRRPLQQSTGVRGSSGLPKLPTSRAQGSNLGPFDLRPEDRQKFPGLPTPPKPPKRTGTATTPEQPKLPFAQQAQKPEPTYTWPMGDNGKLKPVDKLSDAELYEASTFLNNIPEAQRRDAVKKMIDYVEAEKAKRFPNEERLNLAVAAEQTRSDLDNQGLPEMLNAVENGSASLGDVAREMLGRSGMSNPTKDEIDSQIQDLQSMLADREYEKMRTSAWDKFKQWFPSQLWKGAPRGKGKFTYASNQETYDRFRSDYLVVDVMDSAETPGKYTINGAVYDGGMQGWDEYFFSDSDLEFDTIEDAMKWVEDFEERLIDADDQGLDLSDVELPEMNTISGNMPKPAGQPWKVRVSGNEPAKAKRGKGKLLGSRERTHNFLPQALQSAREEYSLKWDGRRRNIDLEDRITHAEDQAKELRSLNDQMWDEWHDMFGGGDVMNQAWNMDTEEFARWAVKSGQVDTIAEGLTLHEEIMDAWDQIADDQDEIGNMLGELNDEIARLKDQWNTKNDMGIPGFEEPK